MVFVKLIDPPAAGTALLEVTQRAFVLIQAALDRVEGSVDKLSVDDKGLVALAVLGLPPHAHVDDPARAVLVAQRIHDQLLAVGQATAIGVATGRVFCRVVGSARRREYTVLGDTVNLAARLMQQVAQDPSGTGVLGDTATSAGARDRVGFSQPRMLVLKGKAPPVAAYQQDHDAPQPTAPARLIGREAGRQQLVALLDQLAVGVGTTLVMDGAAGMGKSRLVHAFRSQADDRGVRCLTGRADSIDTSTPDYAWRSLIAELLVLSDLEAGDREGRLARLHLRMRADPMLDRLAPLLRDLVDVDLPDNDLTAAMKGEVRAFNPQDLVVHLLRQALADGPPVALIFEDAQWLDSASWALLRQAADQVSSLVILLALRPVAEPVPAGLSGLLARDSTNVLHLRPLDLSETQELLQERLGAVPDAALTRLVFDRAEGHPFFTEELALTLREVGAVDLLDGRATLSPRPGSWLCPSPSTAPFLRASTAWTHASS